MCPLSERHVTDRFRKKKTHPECSPLCGPEVRLVSAFTFTVLLVVSVFSYRRRKYHSAGQNDGVQLGPNHERGEQHRGSQCAHHALLLQTGGRPAAAACAHLRMCRCSDEIFPKNHPAERRFICLFIDLKQYNVPCYLLLHVSILIFEHYWFIHCFLSLNNSIIK